MDALESVKQSLARSRRYRHVCAPAVERIAREALAAEGGDARAAQKRAKMALHQVFGAFLPTVPRYERLLGELREAAGDPRELREKLRACMALHASTRERLPILEEFWSEVTARTGPGPRLLDIGCGMNPLAAPWMTGLGDSCYIGVELDARLVEFLGAALELLVRPCDLRVDDVLTGAPLPEADVALALKLLPTLEQQCPGSGAALLDAVSAPIVVASFPRRSLGGNAKGMTETYGKAFEAELESRGWPAERIALPGELVYVVRKAAA